MEAWTLNGLAMIHPHTFHFLLENPSWVILIALTLFGVVKEWRRRIRHCSDSWEARNWPPTMATIDVVSVVEQIVEGRHENVTTGYMATLTYFYRNPDLQMGEYERFFRLKSAAQSWVEQFKGCQVTVHVNPKRLDESVLLDAEVEAQTSRPALSLEEAIRTEKLPELPVFYLFLSGFCELIAFAGFVTSVVIFWRRIVGAEAAPAWLLWWGLGSLLFTLVCVWLISIWMSDGSSMRTSLATFAPWAPAWMRWSLTAPGIAGPILWLIFVFAGDLPNSAQSLLYRMAPYVPYALFCYGFLTMAAFHAAVLGSQEQRLARQNSASDDLRG